jgi:type IV pilus assembly protein PilM
MGNILRTLFARKTDNVIGVDIGTCAVKAVQLDRRQGRPLVKAVGVVDLPPGLMENGACLDPKGLAAVIRQALATGGVRGGDAALAIGVPALFIREISFPPLSADELKEAVKWDSEKYVPFAPESYYYDYAVTGRGASDLELKVMLAAAPRETVDALVDAAKSAGLQPVAIDAEPLAIYRTLPAAANALVVDIGAEISHATIFQDGAPVVARPVPISGQRFTEVLMEAFELDRGEAERLKQRQRGLLLRPGDQGEPSAVHRRFELLVSEAAREAQRTIEYYRIQNKEAIIDKAFLTGGGASLDNIVHYFTTQLDIPVVIHDPLAGVDIAGGFDPQFVRSLGGRFAVAVGLAMRGGEP